MTRNVEIKARVADREGLEARARALAGAGPIDLAQDDTFFACPHGRLKLRELAPDRGELIAYERADVPGPKLSRFTIAPTPAPAALREALARTLGVVGRVRKRRRLYLVEHTRIHLDEVEGLGTFLELEVMLADGQSTADGENIARRLMEALGVGEVDLLSGAYLDLLRART